MESALRKCRVENALKKYELALKLDIRKSHRYSQNQFNFLRLGLSSRTRASLALVLRGRPGPLLR